MRYLPVSIRLEGRPVLVVGGGSVATGRVDVLLEAGADDVTVISPAPSDRITELEQSGALKLRRRSYRSGDSANAHLVMAATDDRAVNASIGSEARAAGALVNVADDPERCDFIMPSLVRRGDLTIAVSTSGHSPALAVRVRQQISRLIGPEFGKLLEILAQARTALRGRVADSGARKRILYNMVDDPNLMDLVRHGNDAAVELRIQELLAATREPAARSQGVVYVVGSGPGDSGLITVRGLQCLRMADVILHDRLISTSLLREAAPGAEVIDVGKKAGDAGKMQRFIEETMVRRARAGEVVCRLKGGDPFVFGRGGEEAEALTSASIAYEIIPGVTSATAAPAAAGIPVTHRDIAHAFLVMTGSRAQKASSREWAGAAELLGAGGTVVIMMGLAHLGAIVSRLEEAGCPADTPVAVVSRGTLPDQEVYVATLESIGRDAPGPSPGVIVFGAVVRERERLSLLRTPADNRVRSDAMGADERVSRRRSRE